jgi:hypothetical protein
MRCILPLLALLLPAPALAQPTPVPMCLEQREGMTFCFESKLCLCRFDAGGTLTGRPSGYRWDCGVLRPSCGVVPPDTNPPMQPPMTIQPFIQPGWPGPIPREK